VYVLERVFVVEVPSARERARGRGRDGGGERERDPQPPTSARERKRFAHLATSFFLQFAHVTTRLACAKERKIAQQEQKNHSKEIVAPFAHVRER